RSRRWILGLRSNADTLPIVQDILLAHITMYWLNDTNLTLLVHEPYNFGVHCLDWVQQLLTPLPIEMPQWPTVTRKRHRVGGVPTKGMVTANWKMSMDTYMECLEKFPVWPVVMPKQWFESVRNDLSLLLLPELASIVLLYCPTM